MPKVSAVIVAAGSSSRMGGVDKLALRIGKMSVLERSVTAFERCAAVEEIVVVAAPARLEQVRNACAPFSKLRAVVAGGETRVDSVRAGVAACSPDAAYYAIHDGARPLVPAKLIEEVIAAAQECGAAAPGVAAVDTVKRVDCGGWVIETLDRDELVAVSTPQVFEASLYRAAIRDAGAAFDDCQLIERMGRRVRIVRGGRDNIKITQPGDLARARFLAGVSGMRIGHGYDVHKLVEGRRLVLGGVQIPFERGLLGHSDADVLVHAVMDAMLGAAALGDIGKLFPDTDPAYAGADSIELLKKVAGAVDRAGYALENLDATVICQAPKLRPFIEEMRVRIADACGAGVQAVNLKATTEEGLGFTGCGEGIAAHAVVLLRDK